MKTYISDLTTNEEVTSFFLIVDAPQIRKSKKGTDYACIELHDKTGKIDARLWNIPPDLDVALLKKVVVKVKGQVAEWQDQKQVSISQIRPVNESDDVDMADFFASSEQDPEKMWEELLGIVHDHMESWGYLQKLVVHLLVENQDAFKRAPAAKSVHHAFLSGLLEHVNDMCRIALPICKNYGLDVDLVLAGCILHDLAKIKELSYDMGLGYTTEGTLIGHTGLGLIMVNEAIAKIDAFPKNLRMAILHLIGSHHGQSSWGATKVPIMREAIVLHLIDLLSSRMGICTKVLKSKVNDEGFSEWVKELEGPVWSWPWKNSAENSTVT